MNDKPKWITKKEKDSKWITKKEKDSKWITKKEKEGPWITRKNYAKFLGEASARITESERELVAKFLKEAKEDKREKAIKKAATKNKRFKGGLMVKPKAAKRGY